MTSTSCCTTESSLSLICYFFVILLWGDRIFLKEYIDGFLDKINVPSRRFSPVGKIPPSTIMCSSLLIFSLTFPSITPFRTTEETVAGLRGCKKCALSLFFSMCLDRLHWQWKKHSDIICCSRFVMEKLPPDKYKYSKPPALSWILRWENMYSLFWGGESKRIEFFSIYHSFFLSSLFFDWLWACVREAGRKIYRFFFQALVAALFHIITLWAEAGG